MGSYGDDKGPDDESRRHGFFRLELFLAAITVALTLACGGSSATITTQDDRLSLVGTWRPIEYSVFSRDDHSRSFPLGREFSGYLIYDDTRHVMFEITRTPELHQQDRLGDGPAQTANGRPLFEDFAGFYGTYSTDATSHTITHRLEGEVPQRVGTMEVVAPYRLHLDTLIVGNDSGARWIFFRVRKSREPVARKRPTIRLP
jgi:hypothetical protein